MKGPPRSRWRISPLPSSFDRRLYRQDIAGSMAHARMLAKQGIISVPEAEADRAGAGRDSAKRSRPGSSSSTRPWKTSTWPWRPASPPRSARWGASSTPPGAGTTRWPWTCASTWPTRWRPSPRACAELRRAGARLARPLPRGHHARATPTCSGPNPCCSPTTCWPMTRCGAGTRMRLHESLARIKVSPLGAAALAGTTFPIDPAYTADQVGFPGGLPQQPGRGERPGFHPGISRPRQPSSWCI